MCRNSGVYNIGKEIPLIAIIEINSRVRNNILHRVRILFLQQQSAGNIFKTTNTNLRQYSVAYYNLELIYARPNDQIHA